MDNSRPKNAYFFHGLWLRGEGRYEEAIAVYRDHLREFPDEHKPHHALAMTFWKMNEKNSAIEECRIALRLKPDFYPCSLLLARIFQEMGRTDEAVFELEDALKKSPNEAQTRLELARIYRMRGMRAEAIPILQWAIQCNASCTPDVYFELSEIYTTDGRIREAINILTSLTTKSPNNFVARLELGKLLERDGRHEEARSAWREMLRLDEEHFGTGKRPEIIVNAVQIARDLLQKSEGRAHS